VREQRDWGQNTFEKGTERGEWKKLGNQIVWWGVSRWTTFKKKPRGETGKGARRRGGGNSKKGERDQTYVPKTRGRRENGAREKSKRTTKKKKKEVNVFRFVVGQQWPLCQGGGVNSGGGNHRKEERKQGGAEK